MFEVSFSIDVAVNFDLAIIVLFLECIKLYLTLKKKKKKQR